MAKTRTKQPATERVSYNSPSEGFWTIPEENGFWRLSDRPIPAMTQDEAARYSSENGFHALSAEEVFAIMGSMYDLRNNGGDIERAREFLRHTMRNDFPSLQTRVVYNSNEEDNIIHGYGTGSVVERKANLVGPDGNVINVLSESASKALTGKTPEQVSELMGYINGTSAYIWRVNSKPKSANESVVRLYAYSGRAGLGAGRFPRDAGPVLGGKFSREAPK